MNHDAGIWCDQWHKGTQPTTWERFEQDFSNRFISPHSVHTITREIRAKFGQPELLITDGEEELIANQTNAYLAKNGVEHIVTTPYHPQANGRVKRLNVSLVQALAKLTAG